MTKLHQIVAIETGEKKTASQDIAACHQRAQKPDLFSGIYRTYAPVDEDGESRPPEVKEVQYTVDGLVDEFSQAMTKLLDFTATKDWGNTVASADIEVDGEVLVQNVPVPYLLFLEKKLDEMRAFVAKLPVLDSSRKWELDAHDGLWKSAPEVRLSTRKEQRPIVLYEATPEHPAQTQMITEDVLQGRWTSIEASGAIPRTQQKELLERIHVLQNAVKFARARANDTDVQEKKVANKIFDFVFGR